MTVSYERPTQAYTSFYSFPERKFKGRTGGRRSIWIRQLHDTITEETVRVNVPRSWAGRKKERERGKSKQSGSGAAVKWKIKLPAVSACLILHPALWPDTYIILRKEISIPRRLVPSGITLPSLPPPCPRFAGVCPNRRRERRMQAAPRAFLPCITRTRRKKKTNKRNLDFKKCGQRNNLQTFLMHNVCFMEMMEGMDIYFCVK